eukprot:COSAG02_NODE_6889_length_3306_cov_3.096040_2_plen_182_part_00
MPSARRPKSPPPPPPPPLCRQSGLLSVFFRSYIFSRLMDIQTTSGGEAGRTKSFFKNGAPGVALRQQQWFLWPVQYGDVAALGGGARSEQQQAPSFSFVLFSSCIVNTTGFMFEKTNKNSISRLVSSQEHRTVVFKSLSMNIITSSLISTSPNLRLSSFRSLCENSLEHKASQMMLWLQRL